MSERIAASVGAPEEASVGELGDPHAPRINAKGKTGTAVPRLNILAARLSKLCTM